MEKIVLIPDSFKGTMSSARVCEVMAGAIRRHYPGAHIAAVPVADGGEGSVDAFLAAAGGRKVPVRVMGPYMQEMDSFYGLLPDGTAVVEMAACAGLPLVGDDKRPDQATTYGVGQLMAHALAHGCRRLVVGLGGSATNDMGAGAAAGMGARFYNAGGQSFVPTGGTLGQIAGIDLAALRERLGGTEVVAMCDIDNPLYGPTGAACVFAPQKGADAAMVERLDEQLRTATEVVKAQLGADIAALPGAGAAGGMGGGMAAFFGARLQPGIETVLDTVGFGALLDGAGLVLTGEGRLDSQTLGGKVVVGVARRAKPAGVPVVAIVGDIGDGIEPVYGEGVTAVFSINRVAVDFSKAKQRSADDLALTVDNLMRFYKAYGL